MTFMDSKEPSVILRVRISTFSIESILSIRLQTHQLTHNVKTRQGDDWFRLCYLRFDARSGLCEMEPSSCAVIHSPCRLIALIAITMNLGDLYRHKIYRLFHPYLSG